jgi:hypothetical protein
MTQVQVFADVHRSADSMWRELGSFQSILRWHPMVTGGQGESEEPGATRTLATRDGLHWAERLTERDAAQRLYRYEAASTELPITDFRGELRIREGRPHRSTVIWTAQFTVTSDDEKSVSDKVREFFRAVCRPARDRIASPGPDSHTAAVSHRRRSTVTLDR